MATYCEELTIDGVLCGIEDTGPQALFGTQFNLWVGGCRVSHGEATKEEARRALFTYMEIRLEREIRDLKARIKLKKRAQLKVMKASPRARLRGGRW